MRITTKIESLAEEGKKYFFSMEFFPPRSSRGRKNLQLRIENMSEMLPLFLCVTCSNGSHQTTLELCEVVHKFCGVEPVIHITCRGASREEIKALLETAKAAGLQNILALQGDPVEAQHVKKNEFPNATELIKFVREEFGDYFCIGVGGYPEGRLDYKKDLQYLKDKVDAGADFILTQMFFDCAAFRKYKSDCDGLGVEIPIIPGILPIQSYTQFHRIVKYLGVKVPASVLEAVEARKSDEQLIKEYGVNLAVSMCSDLLQSGACRGLHFYTMNMEKSVRKVLTELKTFLPVNERILPWRPSAQDKRSSEDVRPIFWANRPKSYLARTEGWDQFPKGRWGENSRVSYADLEKSQAQTRGVLLVDNDERRRVWGSSPMVEQDIYEVFVRHILGTVSFLPWCETPLHLETSTIKDNLVSLNRHGFLTINSQPRVNAAPSSEAPFGWGPPNGYVYQKAYIEFFCSPANLARLMEACKEHESLTYHAVDVSGNTYTNSKTGRPCAVTWGVFPGREVIQPTVVDPESFLVWKDEAFSLWLAGWASIYDEGSESYELVHDIHDQYYLVNIVDSDFVQGDIFKVFEAVIAQTNTAA